MSPTWESLKKSVIYEDSQLLALHKPAGIAVMGDRHEESVVDLASQAGEPLRWLHRIDKATSGAVLLARTPSAHASLTRQFAKRMVDKRYLAWVRGTDLPEQATVELPLRPGRKGTTRVAGNRAAIVFDAATSTYHLSTNEPELSKSYPSTTMFRTVFTDGIHTLLAVTPVTGRRHQIRVHLAWLGAPIVGDPLFERNSSERRTYLHSWMCGLACPWLPEPRTCFVATPDHDFMARFAVADRASIEQTLASMVPAGARTD